MTSTTTESLIDQLRSSTEAASQVIEKLVGHFRAGRQPVELFEALKMQTRLREGLPTVAPPGEGQLPAAKERTLEDGLLQACREVGGMMIRQGRIMEGWMYLRPVGDRTLVRSMLDDVKIDEDNYDAMIQILIQERIDVGRGFAEVLRHQGTCNSITLYEQTISQLDRDDRRAAAACLLDHFYGELLTLVREDVASRDRPTDEHETLGQIIESREWILSEGGYHLDTTHLASTVKIAAVLDDPVHLRKALDLTQYGRRLHHQFQYPGEEPFVDFYPAHATLFRILLGIDVDAGLKQFERKARSVDSQQHGTAAIDTYVDLLARVGRPALAVREAMSLYPDEIPVQHILTPLLVMLRETPADHQPALREELSEYCLRREDLLAYAAVRGA